MHFPVNFKSKIMCQQSRFLFLFFTLFTTHTIAIKVDWNTNTGPIVPPTSTVAPVPKPPFREPAPVWEDQSDDVPNPHQYQYVAPPPSRPRYNDPYRDKDTVVDSLAKQQYGKFIYHPNQIQEHNQSNNYNNKIVNSLTVKYVPNYGNKYVAVVPNNNNNNNNNHHHHHPEPSPSPSPSPTPQSQVATAAASAAVPSATYNIQQKVDYNNNNNNKINNNDIYNNNNDIYNNNNNNYNGIYNNKYEKYDNYYQKYNDKYVHYKMKKYNPYGEKKKYWPIYLYNIPKQQPQPVYVYNYQNQQNTT